MPEIVKKHFTEKRGYANYYFNAIHQQRVWKAWIARANPDGVEAAWTLAGPLPQGGQFRFQLADSGVSLTLPVRSDHVDGRRPLGLVAAAGS